MRRARNTRTTVPQAVLLAATTAVLLAGCAGPFPGTVCTAVGWINSLEVSLTGARAAEVALVELCDEHACSVPGPTAAASPSPGSLYSAREVGTGTWSVELDMSAPGEFELVAYSTGVAEIARGTFTREWRRVGGSEACGGPMATDPVEFTVD